MRPPEHALECARVFNDAALELCARGSNRLRALCQVPLQDTGAACRELTRSMKAGHVGVQIGNHVGDRDLDDAGIVEFLAHCAAEGAPVLVHPWDMLGGERTARHMMGWTVSMPAETQLSIVAMMLGGAFDRLPRSLRICFAHGGGSFAFLLGRLENAWHNRDVARGTSEFPPSHYLDRFSVDSAVFDERALRLLVEVLGEERVMLGSDYPFPLGELQVGKLVRESRSLGDAQRAKILGGNAARFFGLSAAHALSP
jgi:aminocarboxymuconate-semialdehyde decarboxylase